MIKKGLAENLVKIDAQNFRRRGLYDPRVNFTKTRCNFGGYRHWFVCPHCKRRVWVLYWDGSWGCRHCHNLTYRSRLERKQGLLYNARRVLMMSKAIDELEGVKKRSKYKGKPTRKQRKLEWMLTQARISSALIKIQRKK